MSILIDKAFNEKIVEVESGLTFRIELPENPTTGYRWAPIDTDHEMFELIDSSYSTRERPAIGEGGMRSFLFRVIRPGTADLRLELRRPWEEGKRGIERFSVTIRSREG